MADAASLSDEPARRSLVARTLAAVSWNFAGIAVSQSLRLASTLILTRLLAPEAFGLIAIVTMIQYVLTMLADIGLRNEVIRGADHEVHKLLNATWTLTIIGGVVIWGACLVVSLAIYVLDQFNVWPPGSIYTSPELPLLLAVTSSTAFISNLQSNRNWLNDRGLNPKWTLGIDLGSQSIALVVSIVAAWLLASVWAMALGMLTSAVMTTILSHILLPGAPNRLHYEPHLTKRLLGVGIWILLSSLLFAVASTFDKMLIGWWAPASVLGTYAIAQTMVGTADQVLHRIYASVATPLLSETVRERPEKLQSIFFKLRLPFDLLFLSGAGFLFAAGPSLVALLFDARYAPAAPIVQALSFTLISSRCAMISNAFIAKGHTRYLTYMNATRLTGTLIILPLAYRLFGFQGLIYAMWIPAVLQLPLTVCLAHNIGIRLGRYELATLLLWVPGYVAGSLARMILG